MDKNKQMQEIYKNHLCLHCEHISYWDWYICKARKFSLLNFGLREIYSWIKEYMNEIFYYLDIEYSLKQWLSHKINFIPDKPVKKM